MFCNKCGKEIPDGAKFCNHCGAAIPEPAPRHARPEPEPEEIYSFSDNKRPDPSDALVPDEPTRIFDPLRDDMDQTKIYDHDFELFEDRSPDKTYPEADDRDFFNDSYDNYQDGVDDETFMDKLDNRFRRDEYDRKPPERKLTWLWITLGVLAAALIIVFAILAFSGNLFGKNDVKPTSAPTAAATVNPTEKPQQTENPAPTEAPATEAPATEAPETQAPATEPEIISTLPPATVPETQAPTDAPTEPVDSPTDASDTNIFN